MKLNKKNAITFFGTLFGGEHRIPSKVKKLQGGGFYVLTEQTLSTFDNDLLTTLVFLAHSWTYKATVRAEGKQLMLCIERCKQHPGVQQVCKSWAGDFEPLDTPKEEAKPASDSAQVRVLSPSFVPGAPAHFVDLASHPQREQIVSKMPLPMQQRVRELLQKGMAISVDADSILNATKDPMWGAFAKDNYRHMCDVHPDFAVAFKSYLNAMTLDEAVNAAERDLSPPLCCSLREIGEYYQSLPEDERT